MKIKYLIILVALFFSLYGNTYAITLEKEEVDNVWIFRKGGNQSAFSAKFTHYKLNGKTAYCIEPGKHITTLNYNISEYNNIPISDYEKERIRLIGYYGYDYSNHQTLRYKMATQALIWEELSPQKVEYWTEKSGAGTYIDVSKEKNEILELVEYHPEDATFDNNYIYTLNNKEVVFNNTNYYLFNYNIINSNDYNYRIVGNKLYITPLKYGEIIINLQKKGYTTNNSIYFVGEDPNSQGMAYFGLSDNDIITLKVNNQKSVIKIEKFDRDNHTLYNGDSTVIGTIYGIYNINNVLLDEITIDNNGYATYYPEYYGDYYIREIKAGYGYLLDNTNISVSITNKNPNKQIGISNKAINKKIELYKVRNNYVSGIMEYESNITFEIYRDDILIASKKTDNNGYLYIDVPYGTYKFKQINTTYGYELAKEFSIKIDDNSSNITTKIVCNNPKVSKIKIIKKDDNNNILLKDNISFLIINKDTLKEYEYKTKNGIVITDELPFGSYILKENSNYIRGYEINKEEYEFTIDDNSDDIIEIEFINKEIKGNIEIIKLGEIPIYDNDTFRYELKELDDVTYILKANNDIYDYNDNLIYNKNDIIDKYVTKKGIININNLFLGDYCLVEEYSFNNYIKDNIEYCFTLNNDNYIYKNTFINYLKKGTFILHKYDKYDNSLLSNIYFTILNEDNNIVYVGNTDEDGIIRIDDLPYGKYIIKEDSTKEGYLLKSDYEEFIIDDNNLLVEKNIYNERIKVPKTLSNKKHFNLLNIILSIFGIFYEKKKYC